MPTSPSKTFRFGALTLSLTVLAVAVMAATGSMLFGSKFGPLFGMSADAIGAAEAAPRSADAGEAPDAGRRRDAFLGATKAGPVFHERDLQPTPKQEPASPAQQDAH